MSVRILVGDVRAQLRTLPDESVHCVVTSPPYWGLRQYFFDGAVVIRRDLDTATRARIELELANANVKPR